MSSPAPNSLALTSRCARILLPLILATTVGCQDHDPDFHFTQREALGMNRDELFHKLIHSHGAPLDIDFILEDGRSVPYLRHDLPRETSDEDACTLAGTPTLGWEDGENLDEVYSDSRVWEWSPGYTQSYAYVFGDNDRVTQIKIFYWSEELPWAELFVTVFWPGIICAAIDLLRAHNRRVRRAAAEVPQDGSPGLRLQVLKECGIALLVGMIGVEITAVILDPEIVLAMLLMVMPLSIALALYYIVMVLSRSLPWSLFALFVLPILQLVDIVVTIMNSSEIIQ